MTQSLPQQPGPVTPGMPPKARVRVSGHSPWGRALMQHLPSTLPAAEEGIWADPEPFLLLQCVCGVGVCALWGPDMLPGLILCVHQQLQVKSK